MPSNAVLEAKTAKVEQLTDLIKNSVSGVLVDYKGITVEEDTKLRKELREAGVNYFVEKNSMLRFAAKNAGLEGSVIVEKVRESSDNIGFNALTEEYVDMVKSGIVDPTKVTRSALQNAASIASTVLTTEALVADKPEPVKEAPNPAAGGMY